MATSGHAANTARAYQNALSALSVRLGSEIALSAVSPGDVAAAAAACWSTAAAGTWNARRSAVVAFAAWATLSGHHTDDLAALIARRSSNPERRVISLQVLDALWSTPDVALRERSLWRLLYETAARVGEILPLNVPDLDRAARQATVRTRGERRETVAWGEDAAVLLDDYLQGRRSGPVFLSAALATPETPVRDVCPTTGEQRLSYKQASALFRRHSGGATLHQLRHTTLTHMVEAGASKDVIQAKLRHQGRRHLAPYTRAEGTAPPPAGDDSA